MSMITAVKQVLTCFWENLPELGVKIVEQLYLVTAGVGIALCIGIPLGIIAARRPVIRQWVMAIASTLQTIPGLALLVFLLPFVGIGAKPAIIALAIYAILPITTNTLMGMTQVAKSNLEAAEALGFTSWQRLWLVELPLARPTMIGGIRIATTISMGMATLAAFIGAGGLGDFINRGLALNDTGFLLLGAIPAAALALLLDSILYRVELRMQNQRASQKTQSYFFIGLIAVFLGFPIMLSSAIWAVSDRHANVVRVGSGNFTEQILLGEIISQMIENHTSLKVDRKFNLGAAALLIDTIRLGKIDIYPAYTGTAYINTLHQTYNGMSRAELYQYVKTEYKNKFQLVWLAPMGFSDTQAVAVRDAFANQYHLRTISDLVPLAPQLVIGTHPDFVRRFDGLPGLAQKYGMHFKNVRELESTLMYQALQHKDVDVILAFSTDGRIPAYHLTVLEDDQNLFPPYDGAPIVRASVLAAYPELATALNKLANQIDDQTMQKLNYMVDLEKKNPATVARQFLHSKNLIAHP